MFLTKEDFEKIEKYLKLNAKKDSDFEYVPDYNLGENDRVVISQCTNGGLFKNITTNLKETIRDLCYRNPFNFIGMSTTNPTLEGAYVDGYSNVEPPYEWVKGDMVVFENEQYILLRNGNSPENWYKLNSSSSSGSPSHHQTYTILFVDGNELVASIEGANLEPFEIPEIPDKDHYINLGWAEEGTNEVANIKPWINGKSTVYYALRTPMAETIEIVNGSIPSRIHTGKEAEIQMPELLVHCYDTEETKQIPITSEEVQLSIIVSQGSINLEEGKIIAPENPSNKTIGVTIIATYLEITEEAHYTYEVTHTVSFNSNVDEGEEVSGEMTSIEVPHGDLYTTPQCAFTRVDYTPYQWHKGSASGIPIVIGESIEVNQDIELFIEWTDNVRVTKITWEGFSIPETISLGGTVNILPYPIWIHYNKLDAEIAQTGITYTYNVPFGNVLYNEEEGVYKLTAPTNLSEVVDNKVIVTATATYTDENNRTYTSEPVTVTYIVAAIHTVNITVQNGTIDGETSKVFYVRNGLSCSGVLEAARDYHLPTELPEGVTLEDSGILSINNVTSAMNITIACAIDQYTVTLVINNGTVVDTPNPVTVNVWEDAIFHIAPNQYYELPAKTAENIPIVNGLITVENVASNRTITVNCNQIDYWIRWDADGGSTGVPLADHIHGGDILNTWPIYNGTKEGYTLLDNNNKAYWILTDSKGSYEVEMGSDTPYTVIGDLYVKPKWFTAQAPVITLTKNGTVSNAVQKFYIKSDKAGNISLNTSNGVLSTSTIAVNANVQKEITLTGNVGTNAESAVITLLKGTSSTGSCTFTVKSSKTGTIALSTSEGTLSSTSVAVTANVAKTITLTNNTDDTINPTITATQTIAGNTGTTIDYTVTATLTVNGVTGNTLINGSIEGTTGQSATTRETLSLGEISSNSMYTVSFRLYNFGDADPELPARPDTPEPMEARPNTYITLPTLNDYYYILRGYESLRYALVEGWIDGNIVDDEHPLIPLGSRYLVTKDVQLTLSTHDQHAYRVTFKGNGGTGSMPTQAAIYGTDYTIPTDCAFANEGNHFDNIWKCTKMGNEYWSSIKTYYLAGESVKVYDDVQLQPLWTPNDKYSIKYDADGGFDNASYTKPSDLNKDYLGSNGEYRLVNPNTEITLPLYSGYKQNYRLANIWLIKNLSTSEITEVPFGGTYTMTSDVLIKPKWSGEGEYEYLLTNEIPNSVPTFNTSSSNQVTLDSLVGFSNWANQEHQYIVFRKKTGMNNISDYFEYTDTLGGSGASELFDVVPNTNAGIFVVEFTGFMPLSTDDGSATITFS